MISVDFETVSYALGRIWVIEQIATVYSYIIKENSLKSEN